MSTYEMGNVNIACNSVVRVAIYQNTDGNRYVFDRSVIAGSNRLPGNIYADVPVPVNGPSGRILIYVPSAFKVIALPSRNDVDPAPDRIIGGKDVANGFSVVRGRYQIVYIDRGLEQKSQIAQKNGAPFRDVTSIPVSLAGDVVFV